MKKNKKKIAYILSAITGFALIAGIFYPTKNLNATIIESETTKLATNIDLTRDYMYLSDLDYITENNWSYNGWSGHALQKDKNQDGGILSLLINGEKRLFAKGLGVHAKGQVTFDISEYTSKYPRFIAKFGVDASRGSNGSIWFKITASTDGKSWTEILAKTAVLTGLSEAIDVDLDVSAYKYLCIYVDPNGDNSSDHGTIADARLVTKDFVSNINDGNYTKIHKLDYYDNILNTNDYEYNYENNYKLILEREIVNKLRYWDIQYAVDVNPLLTEALDWILSDNRIMEEVIEVGEITNTSKFLTVIYGIYDKYKNELNTENGLLYEKMMIALAAGYSTDRVISPLSFGFPVATYDYVERFEIMKDLYENNKFKRVKTNALNGEFVTNDWFKDYHVELLRMVMQDGTSNGDIIWLNGFTNEKQSVNFHMIDYVSPNYVQDKYYAEANREMYDNKFYLSKYNVPYGLINGAKVPRYWMVFANGGICWNASRVGQSMYRVNGIPATGGYQVGHELYIQYYEDNNGNGYWTPRYGNWSGAGSTWGGSNPYRYIFNWNNKYFTDKHISGSKVASSTGYLYLGQANLNRYEAYKESLYLNLIANSYKDNNKKLDIYFKSLEVNNLNLDTYDYIINLYKTMSVKNEGGTITSSDWYALANKIIDAYRFQPVPMFDLLKVIRPYLDGSEKLDIDRLEKETLERATIASANDTIQVDGVRTHARQLLNKVQPDPISFSFDGKNAGTIVKNPSYQLAWGYSLDGGKTFTKQVMDDSITLTEEELAKITAENDIIVNFMGLTYTFTIDITKGTLGNNLYANDLENRVVGVDLTYEWRNSEKDKWTSYKTSSPDNTGDKTLYVRRGATGRQLASDIATYTFTADNQPYTRKYVPVSHLSVVAFSTQSIDAQRPFYAPNAIDGNGTTLWHTDFRYDVRNDETKPFIAIKLDKPRYISALEFKQLKYRNEDPAYIKNARIYISEDGETWREAGKIENCPQDEELRVINFSESVYGEYLKIEMDTHSIFASLSLVNIFQDMTKNPRPTAGVGYSTTDPTRENVIARLVNISAENYEITSEGGDTHEFTENGEFTFTFIDKDTGVEGSALAKVDWIDKIAPTATIEYSTTNPTNGTVIATLKPNEDVIVTNNVEYQIDEDGNIVDQNGNVIEGYEVDEDGNIKNEDGLVIGNMNTFTYEFISNGEFKFEFEDAAGNKGSETARVNWIDKDAPIATITYDIKDLTNKDVTATITFNEENVTVTNNNGKTDYVFTQNSEFIFEFEDAAGNKGTAIAKVDWIDKKAPNATITYDINSLTNKNVTATITFDIDNVTVTNNDGKKDYVFTKDGEFKFEFEDAAGNKGTATATVNWIDKNAPVGTIIYDIDSLTNKDVTASITFNEEDVTITNNNGKRDYKFTKDGEFTFEFEDAAGNKGTATATVNWIDKDAPVGTITYDIKDSTNKDVKASITFNEEEVSVTNNNGETEYVFTKDGEFTFEFVDKAGNKGSVTAIVNWIDKVAPTAELKYEKQEDKVIVTVINPSKEITFKEGNGVYEYTKNGEYEIVFYDLLGNSGKLIAKIDSIKEEENPNKEDNKPINPDIPVVNPDDNTDVDKPSDNNSNSSTNNTTEKPNENTNINKPNNNSNTNNNKIDNNTDKENNNKPNTNNNTNKEENNTTYEEEKESKRNKVVVIVVSTVLCLFTLCIYVIKKLKKSE